MKTSRMFFNLLLILSVVGIFIILISTKYSNESLMYIAMLISMFLFSSLLYGSSYDLTSIEELDKGIPYTVLSKGTLEGDLFVSLKNKEKGFILKVKKGEYDWPVGNQVIITKNQEGKLSVYAVGSIEYSTVE